MEHKKYRIRVSYKTGDSFNSYDEEAYIEPSWDNLDIAKENLQRIKEHYLWYENKNRQSYRKEKNIDKPKFIPNEGECKKHDFCLPIKIDNGSEFVYSASLWCGYFEELYGAEIVEEKDKNLKFVINDY